MAVATPTFIRLIRARRVIVAPGLAGPGRSRVDKSKRDPAYYPNVRAKWCFIPESNPVPKDLLTIGGRTFLRPRTGALRLNRSGLGLLAAALLLDIVTSASAAELRWGAVNGGRTAPVEISPSSKVGFTQLDGTQTRIDFVNSIEDRLIMDNNNFMEGSGVALGDFDGDGWCDIYFCAIAGTNRLYRNLGNWQFEDVTTKAGVGGANWHSTGATFADLDGDGDLDLLVNTLGQGTHSFENLGGGRFRETTAEAGLASKTGSLGMALGDMDGDGDLDLYVANYGTLAILRAGGRAEMKMVNGQWEVSGPYADRLRMVDGRLEEVGEPDVLYRNDGHGHFSPVPWNSEWFLDYDGNPLPAPWDFGLGVQIRDINEDGYPDIYVCNDFQTVDRVWINDGRGHFRLLSKQAMRQQSFASMGVDFADIDRDGDLDFIAVEMLARDFSHRLRQLGGARVSFPMPGRFDNRPEVMRNTLFSNRGDGTYAEVAYFAGVEASDWSWQPVFLDVDLDGYEDLLIANGNAFDVQDRDTLRRVRSLGKQTPEQTRTNILLYPPFDSPNVAFRNRGDLTFEETGVAWGFASRQISHGIALADLDHDGDLDVVVNCLREAPLVYRNDCPNGRVAVRLRGVAGNVQGIGAKVKLLGGAVPVQGQEIVAGGRYLAGDDPMRVFASGTNLSGMRLEVTWRDGRRSVVTNVLANHVYEVDQAGASASSVPGAEKPAGRSPLMVDASDRLRHQHHEPIFDDYARQPLLMKQMSSLGPGVAWFDLDGDGHDDLFVGTGKGGRIGAYRGDGKGGFTDMTPGYLAPMPDDVTGLAGFAWADGRRALLAGVATYENADHGSAVWSLRLDPASGRLTNSPLAEIAASESSTGPLAVADVDADGDLDLFVGGRVVPGRYPLPASSRLYRQEAGRLVLDPVGEKLFPRIGLVAAAAWSDLDGDGYPELLLACEWGGLKVFQNKRGQLALVDPPVRGAAFPQLRSLGAFTGWWNSIATADLDGDGRMDIVAGNWGLNSIERASVSHPARIYYGDIGGRGAVDLVETEFSADVRACLPRRSLATLSQAAPKLQDLFPSHAAFSRARLPEAFQQLGNPFSELEAATFASLLFLNRDGGFEAVQLPREAQLAPIFGIGAADYDGDGIGDLFLAQNFFAFRPEVSRNDAGCGLLLLGSGKGDFRAVAPRDAGIFLSGEMRGVATSDFDEDGRMDFAVVQNGAATQLFKNERAKSRLRLRLWAGTGNPFGVGATVVGPDQSAQQIAAGAGYWSQNGGALLLPARVGDSVSVRWPGGTAASYTIPPESHEVLIRIDTGLVRIR